MPEPLRNAVFSPPIFTSILKSWREFSSSERK
jgi:hypothetical protein